MSNEISHEDPGTVHITTITVKVLLTYTFVFEGNKGLCHIL